MRSSKNKADFLVKSRMKPAQRELVEKARAGTLSTEEIENCGQPLWVRQALAEIVAKGGKTPDELFADLIRAHDTERAKACAQTYSVYSWNADSLTITPTHGFSYTVEPNELVLVDEKRRQIKIQYTLLNVNFATISEVIRNSTYVGEYTDHDFIELVSEVIQRNRV